MILCIDGQWIEKMSRKRKSCFISARKMLFSMKRNTWHITSALPAHECSRTEVIRFCRNLHCIATVSRGSHELKQINCPLLIPLASNHVSDVTRITYWCVIRAESEWAGVFWKVTHVKAVYTSAAQRCDYFIFDWYNWNVFRFCLMKGKFILDAVCIHLFCHKAHRHDCVYVCVPVHQFDQIIYKSTRNNL